MLLAPGDGRAFAASTLAVEAGVAASTASMHLAKQRAENEARIRVAMDRLLDGEIPAGGRCDTKTLASEAGVDRGAFYGSRLTPRRSPSASPAVTRQ